MAISIFEWIVPNADESGHRVLPQFTKLWGNFDYHYGDGEEGEGEGRK